MKNKKNLIIICNTCYPIPSATGGIALHCARSLYEQYNVKIIYVSDSTENPNSQKADGLFELFPITDYRLMIMSHARKHQNDHSVVSKVVWQLVLFTIRFLGLVDRTLIHQDNYYGFYKKALKVIEKIDKKEPVDVILSVSEPVRAHLVALNYKRSHPNIRWVCYWGDLYATDYFKSNLFYSLSHMLDIERNICDNSDAVLANEEIFEHYCSISSCIKCSSVPYAIDERIFNSEKKTGCLKNTFIYFGSFSQTMRNPEFLLQLFCNSNCYLELYSRGCEELVQEYVEKSNGHIVLRGLLPKEELINRVYEASAIISLGNTDSDFVPSKTLEIVSYRKPIVDLYYKENKYSPLEKYPLLLRIENDAEISVSKMKIENFATRYQDCYVDKNIVSSLFAPHSTENVSKIIRRAVDGSEDTN